jgi:carbamoyltransferase
MNIVGVNLSHDSSACLLQDGKVRCAVASERLSKNKHGIGPTHHAIQDVRDAMVYCLRDGNLTVGDVDWFVAMSADTMCAEDQRELARTLGILPEERIAVLPHPSHHLAHAYSAFYASGFSSAASLIIDCYGSPVKPGRETESAYVFPADAEPREIFKNTTSVGIRTAGWMKGERVVVPSFFQGVGELYRIVTLLLGFYDKYGVLDEAGKTMGLAPYGRPLSTRARMLRPAENSYAIDTTTAYDFFREYNLILEEDGASYLAVKDSRVPFSQFHMDLAAQVQWELEEACLHLVNRLHAETGEERLVLAGGVFLNSVTNYRILRESPFKQLFIFPAATDDGTAIGAAYYVHRQESPSGSKSIEPLRHVYFGRSYGDDETRTAIDRTKLPFTEFSSVAEAGGHVARLLSEGKIVGLHHGGAEYGPRALGHRSILADPRIRDIKDVLNSRVKFREGFRPFAPAVLEEHAEEYFELQGHLSPYMLLIAPVREQYREMLPGITHVDGTARVQTVSRSASPVFYDIIRAFQEATGLPMVLNTSFNLRGKPIVETPLDALACFLATEMDALVLGRYAVEAPDFLSFVPARNVLYLRAAGVWPSGEPHSIHSAVVTPLRDGDAQGRSVTLSPRDVNFLNAMNGVRTLKELGEVLNLSANTLIREALRLYRAGLFHWSHLGELEETRLRPRLFEIDSQ